MKTVFKICITLFAAFSLWGVFFVDQTNAQSCYEPAGCPGTGVYHCEWSAVTGPFWGGSGTGCPDSGTCYVIEHFYRCCDVYPNGWCDKAYQPNGNPYATCSPVSDSQCGGGPSCNDCTPPACPTGSAESPNTGDAYRFTTSCPRGDGCSPAENTRTCYWQRQNLCSSATTSQVYLKSGQSATITSTANTPVNTFFYAFYNIDNPNESNRIVCSSVYIAGWATYQGTCPAGTYQLARTNTYTTARTSETTTFPANSIFMYDANYGGTLAKNLQINAYYWVNGRPISWPESACVFNERLCSPLCSPAACAPTYETVNQGYGSTTFSCTNSPSQCGTESRTCYCRACTAPACAPEYSTTNYGYGTVTRTCTNNCGVSSSRTCYVDRCANCTLPNCPSPLTNTATTTNPNTILDNFRSCTRSTPCGGPNNFGACYEQVSPQPTTSLQILSDPANIYGFSSNTHTGIRMSEYNLNDPLHMTATYTDSNGATDIEAVSVWFRDSSQTGEVASPLWIDTAVNPSQPPKSPSVNSWGFMMRWQGSSWVPYVPSYPSGGTAKWVRAVYSGNGFDIAGPGGVRMVRVTIGNRGQGSITRSGNNVVLPFQLSFTYTSGFETVAQTTYNTYLMGNDVFSFTPNDNYTSSPEINSKISTYWQPGQIRYRTSPTPAQTYARQWISRGTWTIDKQNPVSNNLSVTVVDDTVLELQWNVSDDKGLFAVVGNIYASISMSEPSPISISNVSGGDLDVSATYPLVEAPSSGIGHLATEYAFRKIAIGSSTYSNRVRIDIGDNNEGSLVIYLTVFDMAGNMTRPTLTYSLGDWIVTYGGLAYSSGGMDYEVKTVSGDPWNPVDVLANLEPAYADVSTELFGDSVSGVGPSSLDKSSAVQSYHMRPFSMNNHIPNWYAELIKAYGDRTINGKVDMLPITSVSGNLTSSGGCNPWASVCILHTGNFEIGTPSSSFTCDGKAVFFIDGDLTINNEILNANSGQDACIFVVNGNVDINEGVQRSSSSQIQYDRINAYIIADGVATIDAELGDRKYDGVYIGGGLYSRGGLNMNRSLKLIDRNIYPALLLNYHSKYAVLSNLVFGSQIDMVKTEIGYKPY